MEIDEVMRKLRKLKALYEGAQKINSEGEAQAAAHMIQKLLTEYNLSMEQVDMTEPDKDPILKENVSGFTYKSIGGDWEMYLTSVLCRHNFCRCLQYGTIHKLVIVGRHETLKLLSGSAICFQSGTLISPRLNTKNILSQGNITSL